MGFQFDFGLYALNAKGRIRLNDIVNLEIWRIAALRYRNYQIVILTSRHVVVRQRTPQSARLDSDDRIVLWVKVGIAAEYRRRDIVSLKPAGSTGQRFFDDILEKIAIALRGVEGSRFYNPIELGANGIRN